MVFRELPKENLARCSDDHHGKTSDHEMRTGPGPKNTFSVGFFNYMYYMLSCTLEGEIVDLSLNLVQTLIL